MWTADYQVVVYHIQCCYPNLHAIIYYVYTITCILYSTMYILLPAYSTMYILLPAYYNLLSEDPYLSSYNGVYEVESNSTFMLIITL